MTKIDDGMVIRALSSWDFKVACGLAVLTAFCCCLVAAYGAGYLDGEDHATALWFDVQISGVRFSNFVNALHILIAIAFVTCAVGLWSRKAVGFLLSTFTLLGVGLVYVWWYVNSLAYLRGIEQDFFPAEVEHVGPLMGATWYDISVLGVAITLFAWQVIKIAMMYKRPHR